MRDMRGDPRIPDKLARRWRIPGAHDCSTSAGYRMGSGATCPRHRGLCGCGCENNTLLTPAQGKAPPLALLMETCELAVNGQEEGISNGLLDLWIQLIEVCFGQLTEEGGGEGNKVRDWVSVIWRSAGLLSPRPQLCGRARPHMHWHAVCTKPSRHTNTHNPAHGRCPAGLQHTDPTRTCPPHQLSRVTSTMPARALCCWRAQPVCVETDDPAASQQQRVCRRADPKKAQRAEMCARRTQMAHTTPPSCLDCGVGVRAWRLQWPVEAAPGR